MEPEYEMAIKVCGYLELFWDGHVPEGQGLECPESVCLLDLLAPRHLHIQKLVLEAAAEPTLQAGGSHKLLQAVLEYLDVPSQKNGFSRPRLWRAAKVAGLWMKQREGERDTDYPELYVAVRKEDGTFFAPGREYLPRVDAGNRGDVLSELCRECSKHIASDLIALQQIFNSTPLIRVARLHTPRGKARTDSKSDHARPELRAIELSVHSIRRDVTDFFYEHPETMETVARRLEYVPSFPATVATRIVDVAGIRHWAPFRGVVEDWLCRYVLARFYADKSFPLAARIARRAKQEDSPLEPLRAAQVSPNQARAAAEEFLDLLLENLEFAERKFDEP